MSTTTKVLIGAGAVAGVYVLFAYYSGYKREKNLYSEVYKMTHVDNVVATNANPDRLTNALINQTTAPDSWRTGPGLTSPPLGGSLSP